jgi:N-methylhydantoinase B
MAHGDTRIIPIELQESNYPFRVESFSLREDSGGAGTYRGGLGVRKKYRILQDCTAVLNFERSKCAPWGAAGGREGKSGRVTLYRQNGPTEGVVVLKGEHELKAGDLVMVESGGGGGFGSPEERPFELLKNDLRMGYVSPDGATHDYGEKRVRAARAALQN